MIFIHTDVGHRLLFLLVELLPQNPALHILQKQGQDDSEAHQNADRPGISVSPELHHRDENDDQRHHAAPLQPHMTDPVLQHCVVPEIFFVTVHRVCFEQWTALFSAPFPFRLPGRRLILFVALILPCIVRQHLTVSRCILLQTFLHSVLLFRHDRDPFLSLQILISHSFRTGT